MSIIILEAFTLPSGTTFGNHYKEFSDIDYREQCLVIYLFSHRLSMLLLYNVFIMFYYVLFIMFCLLSVSWFLGR